MSVYLASFILIIILFSGFILIAPAHTKRMTLRTLGIPEKNFRYYSYSLLYKYSTIFSNNDVSYYVDIGWNEKPDKRNPDTGWGVRKSKRVFPLTGANVEIVPEKSIGYEMDRTCDGSTWSNNAYSYTNISSLFKIDSLSNNRRNYYALVYCFVSKDFDGTWARISVEGGASGKVNQEYDLSKKGTWQKLQINFTAKNAIPPVFLFWAKNGVTDFSGLKGDIIFAYPEYGIKNEDPKNPDSGWGLRRSKRVYPLSGDNVKIVPGNSIGYELDSTCDVSTWNKNAYSYTDITSLFKGDSITLKNDVFLASVFCYVSKDFNGSWARISAEGGATGNKINEYDFNKKGIWQKLQINFTTQSGIPPVYLFWSKNGVKDFKNLTGFVIYAFPEYYKRKLN